MVLRSHNGRVYFTSGKRQTTPLRNLITMKFEKTDFLWIRGQNTEIAPKWTLNEVREREGEKKKPGD